MPVLLDLVQRGMANANEVNQVRPRFKKLVPEYDKQRRDSASNLGANNDSNMSQRRHRDISYDGESQSTADGAVSPLLVP